MKAFGLTLLFCIGIYFLAKTTLKPTVKEVETNTGNLNCVPPNTLEANSGHYEGCCIILDRTSVIVNQNLKHNTN
ncbi:hypothetical protein ACFSKN_01055 [Mariniflexile gromovii]|uniref:Uncharacterized protein n=1 Tax=Mariniflexile gromovii TaxID=362523 RepID=A0ABS4BSA4_9FLAO|nr:hypothetical protein [Mariniflexile gromovii]MBP0903466.1 hypothetical protein [Mariniflexile gromovii]